MSSINSVMDRLRAEEAGDRKVARERAWRERDVREIEELLRTRLTASHERALREVLKYHRQALEGLQP